jgi:hypothetical protein
VREGLALRRFNRQLRAAPPQKPAPRPRPQQPPAPPTYTDTHLQRAKQAVQLRDVADAALGLPKPQVLRHHARQRDARVLVERAALEAPRRDLGLEGGVAEGGARLDVERAVAAGGGAAAGRGGGAGGLARAWAGSVLCAAIAVQLAATQARGTAGGGTHRRKASSDDSVYALGITPVGGRQGGLGGRVRTLLGGGRARKQPAPPPPSPRQLCARAPRRYAIRKWPAS